MNLSRFFVLCILVSWGLLEQSLFAQSTVSNMVLVRFKEGVEKPRMSRLNAETIKKLGDWSLIKTAQPGPQLVEELRKNPDVLYAEPNYPRTLRRYPDDPAFFEQWSLENTGQVQILPSTTGADMDLVRAWNITTGSPQVVIAVIDDSIDINHPDLKDNIWTNPGEIPDNGIDDDQNGYVDDIHGWDFVDQDNDPSANHNANQGHGTSVSGVIAAVGNNRLGITGVAWNVKIMPIKFDLSIATEVQAIDYAIKNGAHIVNASWGGSSFSNAEFDAVKRLEDAGVLLVVAAGNSNLDNDITPDYPSGLDLTNILSVASSLPNDALSSFTHFGLRSVDLAAPGSHMITTRSLEAKNNAESAYFGYVDGTSFSAPSVCGVAALLKSHYPGDHATQLIGRILNGVEPVTGLKGVMATDGRVNAYQALKQGANPLLVIDGFMIDDSQGNANGFIDQGETFDLSIQLRNRWVETGIIQANLTIEDLRVRVEQGETSYPKTAQQGTSDPLRPFRLRSANTAGLGDVPAKLTLRTSGYQVERWLRIPLRQLKHQQQYEQLQIQSTPVDGSRYFYIQVPKGVESVTVKLSSKDDLDLKIRRSLPFENDASADTWSSSGLSGNEEVLIENPAPDLYHVRVKNASSSRKIPFQLEVQTKVNQGTLLDQGWNFLAFQGADGVQAGTLFEKTAFTSGKVEVSEVWGRGPGDTTWMVYSPEPALSELQLSAGTSLGELQAIDGQSGYWLKLSRPAIFTDGASLTQPGSRSSIELKPGWNLISAQISAALGVTEYFSAQNFSAGAQSFDSVWSWLPQSYSWEVYSPTEGIQQINNRLGIEAAALSQVLPSKGYLIHMREAATFVPPN